MSDIKKRIEGLDSKQKADLARKLKERIAAREKSIKPDYDVIVLGGGYAGQTLARQIIREKGDVKILVIEKNTFPCPEIAFKVGESASELQAHYLGEILGLRDHMKEGQIEKGGARYFFPFEDNGDISTRMEVGLKNFPPVPGFQFDRGVLENHLHKENSGMGITYWEGSKVGEVALGTPHKVTVIRDGESVEVSASWVVDSSGRAGILKRKLDLAEKTDHASSSAWLRVGSTVNIEEWSDDPAWSQRTLKGLRTVGTSHLMGKGYWVWIIVLPTNATSIGIVADPAIHPLSEYNTQEGFINWLRKHEPQCAKAIEIEQENDRIKDFLVIKHFSHGCKRLFSKERWCIVGEAGVFADPFYSPGGDVIAIANTLICNLITKDLKGENIAALADQYEFSYLSMFKSFMKTYEGQYDVMGNQQVMLAKIIWDWGIYWGVNAFLFFNNNKAFDWNWLSSVQKDIQKFSRINDSMQSLFKRWTKIESPLIGNCMFSLLDLDFLYQMHTGLVAKLTDDEARTQLAKNIEILEILAGEYSRHVESLENPGQPVPTPEDMPIPSEQMKKDLKAIWIA